MASTQHDLNILNNLIEVTLDSAHGYEDASKDTRSRARSNQSAP